LPSGLAAGQEPLKRSGIAQFVRVKPDVRANHADRREPLPDVDMLPRAITLSAVQCAHRGGRRCIASQIVRLPAAELQRRLIRWIGYLMPRRLVADAAHVRGDQVAAADIPVGRLGAKKSYRHDDQLRKSGRERAPVNPQLLVQFRTIRIENNVRRREQIERELAPAPVFQVDRHAELVGVEVEMQPAGFGVGHLIAKRPQRAFLRSRSRRLDLDDLGAEIGERLRGHRCGQKRHRVEARQLDDLEAFERARRFLEGLETRHRYSSISAFRLSMRSISSAIERITWSGLKYGWVCRYLNDAAP